MSGFSVNGLREGEEGGGGGEAGGRGGRRRVEVAKSQSVIRTLSAPILHLVDSKILNVLPYGTLMHFSPMLKYIISLIL